LCFGNKFKKGKLSVVCLFQTINCRIQTTKLEQLKAEMVGRQLAIFDKTFRNMIYSFKGFVPVVHSSSFIHPQAAVTGNVIIGKNVYVGPGAAIRGDWGGIVIEDGCNVQENCTIHMFPGVTVLLKEGAHIGHGAVIHGATIGRNCLVGMNSVIMDNVELGDECIVGALSFIKADEKIPARSLLVGNPAKIIKQVSDEMIGWKTAGTKLYQMLPGEMMEGWVPCEALTEIPADRPEQSSLYKTWNAVKGAG
jgi:phenylacetic acid degradation protein